MEKSFQSLTDSQEEVFERQIIWLFSDDTGLAEILKIIMETKYNFIDEPSIGKHLNTETIINSKPTTYFERQQGHQLPRYNYFFFEGFQDIWKFYLRKLILNRIYSQFNDFSQVAIKDCKNNFAPDIISSCLPKSKLIILSGDKKDYLDLFFSQNRNFVKKADSSHTDKKFEKLFTIQARRWFNKKRLLLKAYDNHEPSLRLLIKSEDLKENIEEELEKIFNFLKLELSELEKINIIKKSKDYLISLNKKEKNYNNYEKNKFRCEQILRNINEIRF